jgi:D-beta-D-heptose 7-phosphate kinase/D-beta-D-heptose 1-phosphate adenosyltransferase
LRHARSAADALVVGLNDDASVRRLKGDARPLVPAEERAELLEALEAVDRVVVFDQDTPRELILALEPDVLVKGADWETNRIVGAKEVASWGGRVLRAPLVEGASSSALIERIRRPGGI